MKIAATKVFARFINSTAAKMGFQANAEIVYFSEMGYKMNVNIWGPDWVDYDAKRDKFRAIRVVYPNDYHANPTYLTTPELCKEFRRRGVTDIAALQEMIQDFVSI